MWHDARRQEKAVRNKMVDNAKRHERRKQFYESVVSPEEYPIKKRRSMCVSDQL